MTLGRHLLVSMVLTGGVFAVLTKLGADANIAFGLAGFVFLVYWCAVFSTQPPDLGDFL